MLINLLPKEQYDKIKIFNLNRRLLILGSILILINFLVLVYLVTLNLRLKRDYKMTAFGKDHTEIRENVQELEYFSKELTEFQYELNDAYIKYQSMNGRSSWYESFYELSNHVDAGLKIKKIDTISNDPRTIAIWGRAIDREKLLEFNQELRSMDIFLEVNFPLENLTREKNIDFYLEIVYKNNNDY